MAQQNVGNARKSLTRAATVSAYLGTIAMLMMWSFTVPDSGATKVYAQGSQRANAVRRVTKTGDKLEMATRKLAKRSNNFLAAHVLSVHTGVPEDVLLSRSEGLPVVAPAAVAARETGQPLGQVMARLGTGVAIGDFFVESGVTVTAAQTALNRVLSGVNNNLRAAKGGLADTDDDGIPNASDDDADQDGIPNSSDVDADGDGTLNKDDSDIDDDRMPNSADDDIDGDDRANYDDDDIDGDGTMNRSDDDSDGDDVDDDSDDDSNGDGVDDKIGRAHV